MPLIQVKIIEGVGNNKVIVDNETNDPIIADLTKQIQKGDSGHTPGDDRRNHTLLKLR
jgi:hypothetical protein